MECANECLRSWTIAKGWHLLSKNKCVQKTRTKDNKKSLKVSQALKEKNEGRNVVYIQKNGLFKAKQQFFSLKRSSNKCQHLKMNSIVKWFKMKNKIKVKDNKGEIPKATCFLSIINTISNNLGKFKSKHDFDSITP